MKTSINSLLKLLAIAMVPLFLSGCLNDLFDSNEITYEGEPKVEFQPTSQNLTLTQDQSGTIGVDVQLIGEQRNEDLPLNVVVVDSLTSAVAGEHYTLPSTSVTIPADSSVVQFPINVTGENLTTGNAVQLVLELQSEVEAVQPAENLKRFTLTLLGG